MTDGTVTILVDPQTYEPILWQYVGPPERRRVAPPNRARDEACVIRR
jgi:hypothetical protein